MNKFEIKSQKTRALLIEAFWALTKEKELPKVKIKDVTDRAGFYRSTFYLHFTDICDLLDKEENLLVDKWKDKIQSTANTATPEELLRTLSDYYVENGDKVFTLLRERIYSKYEYKMKQTILEHIHTYYPHANSDIFDYSFEFYIGGIIDSMLKWDAEGRKADINEIIEYILQWIQHGIGSNYWTLNQRNNTITSNRTREPTL